MSAHKYSLFGCTLLISAFDYSWLHLSNQECSWPLIRAHECSWRHRLMQIRVHSCSWAFIRTNERSQALLSTHRQSWPIQHTHEDGAVAQSALMSTQEHSWQHGNMILTASKCPQVLISAHGCWVLMSANSCSIVLMTAQSLNSTQNQNVNFWNDLSVVICKYLSLDFTK